MSYLQWLYLAHPEYRKLRIVRRSPVSVHFELERGLYQAHFQMRPMFTHVLPGVWMPAGNLASAVRLAMLGALGIAAAQHPRVALAAMLPLAFAVTDTFQPGATGYDAYVRAAVATTNYGTADHIYVGDVADGSSDAARSLIKWDISTIPASATVSAATASLYEDAAAATEGGSWAVNFNRCLKNWVELECTWNNLSTSDTWTTAGCGAVDHDYDSDVSATVTLDGTAGSAFVDFSGSFLVDDVRKYVDGTYNNYGWRVAAPNAEYRGAANVMRNDFVSSDHVTAAQRPKLVTTYTIPNSTITERIRVVRGSVNIHRLGL